MPEWLNVIFEFTTRTFEGIFAIAGILFILLGLLYNRAEDIASSLLNPGKFSIGGSGDPFIIFGIIFLVIALVIYLYKNNKYQ